MAPKKTFHFADRLVEAIRAKGSPICVGLDPRLKNIPEFLKKPVVKEKGNTFDAAAQVMLNFNKGIIDAVFDLVPAVKPQIAFYEQYGFAGMWAFEETCKYAREKGLIIIADAKRNDIGSTAEAYAREFLGKVDVFGVETESPIDADAVTVTAYLGFDGVKPFIEQSRENGKGIFLLVKTSNTSSGDLQDRVVKDSFGGTEGLKMYELLAHLAESWGSDEIGESGYSSVGAVVGATFPRQAAEIRKILPQAFFLVPGFGAQGATAKDVAVCFNKDGLGALVNSSRDIIFAWEKSDTKNGKAFGEDAREAVLEMKKELEDEL